ncbi:MAG: hypothetical protein Q8M03_01340 [Legionella sp.]|nr:hypothetical protein [Legionella sp.]
MIKKLSVVCLLSLPFYAYSAVEGMDLPLVQNVAPQNTSYAVPLDGLKENSLYQVTCSLTNTDTMEAKFMVEPRLLASSHYGNVQLNNLPFENNMGALQQGENQLSFQLLVEKTDREKYNRFVLTPLTDAPLQVNQCVASEITPSKTRNTEAIRSDGGFFFAFNDTDNPVTIAVGNIWPTQYVIKPHDYRTVWVSSDNQDIRIKK